MTKSAAENHYRREIEARVLRPYMNGKQFIQGADPGYIIDFFGFTAQQARSQFPELFQKVIDEVKPQRDSVNRKAHRERYWVFGEPRSRMRPALENLKRYVATCRTARHRTFGFLSSEVLPDTKIIAIGLEEPEYLSILSSSIHQCWAIAMGGNLGVGNDASYNHADCFAKFPFPDLAPSQRTTLCQLGEELNAHRKERQAQHPKLTLTQMYNTLEKLRAGEAIEGKDREIYKEGLIGLLKDIHERIDAAVAEAYGWPVDLSENDTLMNLVALNHERAEEETLGRVRWLRPDYQNPDGRAAETKTGRLEIAAATKAGKPPWPKSLPDQIAAVREALEDLGEADAETVARTFTRGRAKAVEPLLETLAGLGMAEVTVEGRYAI